jgi:hypothetical protein
MHAEKVQVTMTLADLNEMRDQIEGLNQKNNSLQRLVNETATGGAAQECYTALLFALPLVQFAVANGEGLRGFPHAAAQCLARELRKIPGISQQDIELARAIEEFALEAARRDP